MTPPPAGAPPDDGWHELLDQIDVKHGKAHDRLRTDLQACVDERVRLAALVERNYRYFDDQSAALRLRIAEVSQLASRPVEGINVVWSTKALASIFSAALVVAGAFIWMRYDLQALRTELTLMSTVQNDRYDSLKSAITDLRKQREDDKREAQQKLSDFLSQSLEKTMIATRKGAAR